MAGYCLFGKVSNGQVQALLWRYGCGDTTFCDCFLLLASFIGFVGIEGKTPMPWLFSMPI
jgi:hypothetical protein